MRKYIHVCIPAGWQNEEKKLFEINFTTEDFVNAVSASKLIHKTITLKYSELSF